MNLENFKEECLLLLGIYPNLHWMFYGIPLGENCDIVIGTSLNLKGEVENWIWRIKPYNREYEFIRNGGLEKLKSEFKGEIFGKKLGIL